MERSVESEHCTVGRTGARVTLVWRLALLYASSSRSRIHYRLLSTHAYLVYLGLTSVYPSPVCPNVVFYQGLSASNLHIRHHITALFYDAIVYF